MVSLFWMIATANQTHTQGWEEVEGKRKSQEEELSEVASIG